LGIRDYFGIQAFVDLLRFLGVKAIHAEVEGVGGKPRIDTILMPRRLTGVSEVVYKRQEVPRLRKYRCPETPGI